MKTCGNLWNRLYDRITFLANRILYYPIRINSKKFRMRKKKNLLYVRRLLESCVLYTVYIEMHFFRQHTVEPRKKSKMDGAIGLHLRFVLRSSVCMCMRYILCVRVYNRCMCGMLFVCTVSMLLLPFGRDGVPLLLIFYIVAWTRSHQRRSYAWSLLEVS